MDKQKLLKQVNELKKEQIEKYSICIRNLINKYPNYYKNKKYAQAFNKKMK